MEHLSISIVAAYLLSGLGFVLSDFKPSIIDRPFWAQNPTARMFALMMLVWPMRLFHRVAGAGRLSGLVTGLWAFCFQMTLFSALIHLAIVLAEAIAQKLILVIPLSIFFSLIAIFIFAPILSWLLQILIFVPTSWLAALISRDKKTS